MASQDNDTSGATIVAVVVGGFGVVFGAIVIGMAVAAIAYILLATVLFTVLSVLAWTKPLHIWDGVVTPGMAHNFVLGGVCGSVVVLICLVIAEFLLGIDVPGKYIGWFIIGGYVAGAFICDHTMVADDLEEYGAYIPPPPADAPDAEPLELPQPQPFKFATWDDEEAGR
jgi:hypothetical protein